MANMQPLTHQELEAKAHDLRAEIWMVEYFGLHCTNLSAMKQELLAVGEALANKQHISRDQWNRERTNY